MDYFTINEDKFNTIPIEERLASSIKIADTTKQFQESLKDPEPDIIDKTRAAFNEFVIGGRYMTEMAIQKKNIYNLPNAQPIDPNFIFSDRFKELVKENGLSAADTRAMQEEGVGNEQEFFMARSAQNRYHEDQKVLEHMSPLALVTTGVGMSLVDPFSWVTGAIIMKPFQAIHTGANIGEYTRLGLKAAEGATTTGLIAYASEASNQAVAGIQNTDKLNTLTTYGAAFGLALPVIPSTLYKMSEGIQRQAGALATSQFIQSSPVTSSIRKYLSLGAGEQTKWSSPINATRELSWAISPSTGIRRDAMGNPVVQGKTAMDFHAEFAERPFKEAMEGMEKAVNDTFGGGAKGWYEASKAHGEEIRKIIGTAEQSYGRQIVQMTPDEQLFLYKNFKGIKELPEEAARVKEVAKLTKARDAAIVSKDSKQVATLNKKLDKLNSKPIEHPEDMFNTLRAALHKDAVENGTFKLPEHLEYIGKFFKDYSKWGDKSKLPGFIGREGYGYFPVRYDRDFAIAHPTEYKQMLEQALRTDSYNAHMIATGKLSDKQVLEQVEAYHEKAIRDDIRFKYLDKGVESGAGSSSKQRKLHINRADFPQLFKTDIVDTLGHYSREQGGRLSFINTFNVDPFAKGTSPRVTIEKMLEGVIKEGQASGVSAKQIKADVDNLRAMLEGVLDIRRLQHDPSTFTNTAVRTLKALASTTFSAGFVKYNMVEWLSGATHTGFKNTISSYIPALNDVISRTRGLPTGSPEFEAIKHTVLASHSLMGQMFSRLDANELTGKLSVIENNIQQLNNGIRKYSGFNITTDINEIAAAGAAMKKLFSLEGKQLTPKDIEWLSRYSMSEADLRALATNPAIKRDNSGRVIDYGIGSWVDEVAESNFLLFMERASRDSVPVPNASSLHRFQSDVNDPIKSMFFQYSQMPTVLWDKILVSTLDKPTADAAAGMISAVAGLYLYFKLDDEMKVRLGLKDELSDDKDLFTKALLSTGYVGVGGMAAQTILNALGKPGLGSSYRPGSAVEQVAGASGFILNKGKEILASFANGDAEKGMTKAMDMAFINSFPLLGLVFRAGGRELVTKVTE